MHQAQVPLRTRSVVLDVAAAAAAAATYVALLLVTGGIWENVGGSDLHGAFIPRYEAVARAVVHEHRLPLWNPWELCGSPLHGTAQGGALYPPVLLAFSTLAPWTAVQALYGFHAFVLAWGLIVYLRRHAIGRLPAILAAFVTFAGVATSHAHVGFDHPNFLGSVAWVPLLLLAWERTVADGVRPWLGVFALVSATQWCVSYPDFGMDMPVLLGLIALVTPLGSLPQRLLALGAGLVLGAALAAAQLAPLADAVATSARSQSVAYGQLRRLLDVPTLELLPAMRTRIGVAALLLAAAGAVGGGRAAIGWLFAVVWASFALKPPFVWLYEIPPYSGSRFPFAWGNLAPLFLGLLVAAGVGTGLRARARGAAAAAIGLGLLAGATTAAVLVQVPRELSARTAGFADPPAYDVLAERAARIDEALQIGGPRFVSGMDIRTGAPLRHRLPAAGGYDPTMPPRRIARLLDAAGIGTVGRPAWWEMNRHAHLVDRLGVGTLVLPAPLAQTPMRRGFVKIAELSGGDVVLAKHGVPRARIVHAVMRVTDENAAFALVADPAVQPGSTVVIEAAAEPVVTPARPGTTEHLRIDRDDPEHLALEVTLATDGLVVVTDTWAPGWHADVDGTPTEVLLADYAFRAVAVPAGQHRVTFRYRPRSIVVGALVSGAAALVVLLLLVSGAVPAIAGTASRPNAHS